MPTASTIPLIILVLVLWRMTKGQILPVVLFTSIFDAASALNIAGLGVPPWLFALLICLVLRIHSGHGTFRFIKGVNRVAVLLISAFFCYSLFSGLVYPFLFKGAPVVNMSGPVAQPLVWNHNNLAQLCYLLAAAFIFFLTVSREREELQNALVWYIRACLVIAGFAFYQLASASFHIPYPDQILYSNPSHVIFHAYKINGMWRLNSTFSEASAMASYMTVGLALQAWTLATRPLSARQLIYFLVMVVALLLTVSSIAYACLIFTVVAGGVMHLLQVLQRRRIAPLKVIIAIALLTGGVALFSLSGTAGDSVAQVVTLTLLNKKDTQSYRERALTSEASLVTLSETYYMGAGWGSVRASGLVYILLGNVGIIGLCLFFAGYFSLFIPIVRLKARHALMRDGDLFERSLFALTVLGLGLILAGTEPVEPILWALFGIAASAKSLPIYRYGQAGNSSSVFNNRQLVAS
jgi:hypothetical protein